MRSPLFLAAVFAALIAGCGATPSNSFQGYAEGEYVLVASPFAGTLERLEVARGRQVASGAQLYVLERAAEDAAVREAQARVRNAEARQANLAGAKRKSEIDALRAEAAAGEAALRLSESNLGQQRRLFNSGFIAQARLDEAQASRDRDAARLAEARAQLRTATQSIGREQEQTAARADIEAANAALAQAQTRYRQKEGVAPAAALVQDTFYNLGEWVPAGSPVVSLLPPENIKVRFFVPEGVVGTLRPGQAVALSCSGCGAPIAAGITFIAPQAEYTPPVIYSKESRAKLVFLVEAKPSREDAVRLKPGQPVDVELQQK